MNIWKKLRYNSPVVLTFALVSLGAMILGQVTGGLTNAMVFSVYRAPLTDPLTYVRLLGHVLGHADYTHWSGNMMLFLLLGPLLEEKYGSRQMLEMFAVVAVVTGLINMIFFPQVMLMGASGIVFMMIILSSVVSVNRGEIPVTLILVAVLYLSREVYGGLFGTDNIAQLTHIIGGGVGCVFGLFLRGSR